MYFETTELGGLLIVCAVVAPVERNISPGLVTVGIISRLLCVERFLILLRSMVVTQVVIVSSERIRDVVSFLSLYGRPM